MNNEYSSNVVKIAFCSTYIYCDVASPKRCSNIRDLRNLLIVRSTALPGLSISVVLALD